MTSKLPIDHCNSVEAEINRMATVAPRTGDLTFDDFLAIVSESEKADLLDGVIFMASPESTDHNDLGLWLCTLMREFAEQLNVGKVYYSRVAFRITTKRGPEPDIAFVAKKNLHRVKKGFVAGPPDIAVEIVSPDSVERDYVTKRAIYEKAGVREYWIIDPDKRTATFLRRTGGEFQEVKPEGNIFESSVLGGFRFDVRWLWNQRRPSALRVLQDLLEMN
jgi:Uma2 family endonuclease